jgi:F-box protein 21
MPYSLMQTKSLTEFNSVDDKSSRYVAEENIAVTNAHPSEALMQLAGRYFKRYDGQAKKFVSNIKEEYPDD